ncbi:hypothetical protein AB6A40_002756 [Gnathostoma spinigerum]|uniref:Chromo domain-containing protein n=1 Tax=Gnathostoma spinigerum TaxID=75299 RepID=A0ABD6E9S2_9BILA
MSSESGMSSTFEVEKIVGIKHKKDGSELYKVRWLGFGASDDTWEPIENLTEDCLPLIEMYREHDRQRKEARNERKRKTQSKSLSCEREESASSSHKHWEYETIKIMTPEEWNPAADIEKGEVGSLYIPDRIPTETEKLLCGFGVEVGRITRNQLSHMRAESVPKNEERVVEKKEKSIRTARAKVKARKTKRTNLRKKQKKNENCDEGDNLADESSGDHALEKSEDVAESEVKMKENGNLNEAMLLVDEDIINSVALGSVGCAEDISDDTHVVVDESSVCDTEKDEAVSAGTTKPRKKVTMKRKAKARKSVNGKKTRRELPKASEADTRISEMADGSESEMVNSETSEAPSEESCHSATATSKHEKANACDVQEEQIQGIVSTKTRLPESRKGPEKGDTKPTSDDGTLKESSQMRVSAVVSNKPADTENSHSTRKSSGDIPEISVEAIASPSTESPKKLSVPTFRQLRRDRSMKLKVSNYSDNYRQHYLSLHCMNRNYGDQPAYSFSELRKAVLNGNERLVRATARCPPERRGFDINEKYRGKTLAIEACELPCDGSHCTDNILQYLIDAGARLDLADDFRGRIPLHYAVANDYFCRVRILLQLRSPVSYRDHHGISPLELAICSRGSPFLVLRNIYLLFEYGADPHNVILRHRNDGGSSQRFITNLIGYERELAEKFEEVRMKTFVNMSRIRSITQLMIRPVWESEASEFCTEFGFNHDSIKNPLGRPQQTYAVLLAVYDHHNARSWRIRMWGESPFTRVEINGKRLSSVQGNHNGFVYFTALLNGRNTLKVGFLPNVQTKKLILLAQVIMVEFHKQVDVEQQVRLEVATDSGTDWRRT